VGAARGESGRGAGRGVPVAALRGRRRLQGEVWAGRLPLPVVDGKELFARGLLGVELGANDVPPFAAKPDWCPVFLEASVRQFEGLEDADDVLVNSFHEIEPKVSSP